MIDVGEALHALADSRRQAMLALLRERPMSSGEIASAFDITQQGVSQHLQVLKHAGLVTVEHRAQRRIYALDPDGLEAVHQFIADLWPTRLQQLKSVIEEPHDVP